MRYRIWTPFFSIEPHHHSESKTKVLKDQLRIQNREVNQNRPKEIKMENKSLPYPTGPNLLDNLVPHSFRYNQKPQYFAK